MKQEMLLRLTEECLLWNKSYRYSSSCTHRHCFVDYRLVTGNPLAHLAIKPITECMYICKCKTLELTQSALPVKFINMS